MKSIKPDEIVELSGTHRQRLDLWSTVFSLMEVESALEIGVWKGEFAAEILKRCPSVARYYMIDPWKHLDQWNKPFNKTDSELGDVYAEAMAVTDFAREKRVVLRGRTVDVIGEIADESLDAVYVDGDHSLRGISIDLIRAWPKVKPGGLLAGDDFSRTIWQHGPDYEPSLVAPFAVYFAEAVGAPIAILRRAQYAIFKPAAGETPGFGIFGADPGDGFPLLPRTAGKTPAPTA